MKDRLYKTLLVTVFAVLHTHASHVIPIQGVEVDLPDNWVDRSSIGENIFERLLRGSSESPQNIKIYEHPDHENVALTFQSISAPTTYFPSQSFVENASKEQIAEYNNAVRNAVVSSDSFSNVDILSFKGMGKKKYGDSWSLLHQVKIKENTGETATLVNINAPFETQQITVTLACPSDASVDIKSMLSDIIASLHISRPEIKHSLPDLDEYDAQEFGSKLYRGYRWLLLIGFLVFIYSKFKSKKA